MIDGNLKSVKVYAMFALALACFSFLWFGKMGESTVMAMLVPTFIAWLAAHVTQQREKLKNGGK